MLLYLCNFLKRNFIVFLHLIDYVAFFVFVIAWVGYTYFSHVKAKTTPCIARCTHLQRVLWMRRIFDSDVRVSHAALLANLERNVAFFASTTMIVLAGVLTLFAQVDNVRELLTTISVVEEASNYAIQVKLTVLVLIFVLAFFQFTWSMRQYGFVNIMIGSAPVAPNTKEDHLLVYAKQMALVQDQAAYSYNYGLRSYYFALSVLTWFFHPLLFLVSSLLVVFILYHREFKSKSLIAIEKGLRQLEKDGIICD